MCVCVCVREREQEKNKKEYQLGQIFEKPPSNTQKKACGLITCNCYLPLLFVPVFNSPSLTHTHSLTHSLANAVSVCLRKRNTKYIKREWVFFFLQSECTFFSSPFFHFAAIFIIIIHLSPMSLRFLS